MSATLKFDWAIYFFPEPMNIHQIIAWLDERHAFAKQMKIEMERIDEIPTQRGGSTP